MTLRAEVDREISLLFGDLVLNQITYKSLIALVSVEPNGHSPDGLSRNRHTFFVVHEVDEAELLVVGEIFSFEQENLSADQEHLGFTNKLKSHLPGPGVSDDHVSPVTLNKNSLAGRGCHSVEVESCTFSF